MRPTVTLLGEMINWLRVKTSSYAPPVRWLIVAGLLGYGVFIGIYHAPVAAGADSSGYLSSARLLTEGKLRTTTRSMPEYHAADQWMRTPLGYHEIPGTNILRPTYPIGMPLHYAAAGLLLGWFWGPLLVGVIGSLVAVILCYLCARELSVRPVLALAGAVALAISPLFLFSSFTPMSDVVATLWCCVAFLAALRSRLGWKWAAGCGVAFSMAVLVRPANIILLPALMLLLWNWRNLFSAGFGALPGAMANAGYNQYMWGSPFLSGYGSMAEAFQKKYFALTLTNYAETMPLALPVLLVGILLLPRLPWRRQPRELGACVLWALAFFLFYAFYEFTYTMWWFLRFVLPAFPALIILSVAGIDAAVEKMPERRRRVGSVVAAVVVTIMAACASVKMARERHFMLMKDYQQPYLRVTNWARENMPAGSLIACMQNSGTFYYYTDFPIVRSDLMNPAEFDVLTSALRQSRRPLYAVLMPFEEPALTVQMPGRWEKVADLVGVGVWKWNPAL